ncbi:MAG: LLM class flavin-dependent oxidoreductase [Candidatus Ranarchaeia archaeon]
MHIIVLSFSYAFNQLSQSPHTIIKHMKEVERAGFSMLFFADDALYADPFVMMPIAIMTTSTIRVGAFTNPYTRHPAYVASQIAPIR